MKGNSSHFGGYNSAESSSIGVVRSETEVSISKDEHTSIPTTGKPNSVTIIKRDGKIEQERYYDGNGEPYLDIDYSDHGNPKKHPEVPHEHTWDKLPNGKYKRNGWRKIQWQKMNYWN